MKLFVSYSHKQGDWVWSRLVPILTAGGAELLIDRERFAAGKDVGLQAELEQRKAGKHLLVLSDSYVQSRYCMDELQRAVASDPSATQGLVIVLRRDGTAIPPPLNPDNLRVELQNEADPQPWKLLLRACDADLGVPAPAWLAARDELLAALARHKSVNLVVASKQARWRELLRHVQATAAPDLALVDLQDGRTATREGLLSEILDGLGMRVGDLPRKPRDLVQFTDSLLALRRKARVALTHFDLAPYRHAYDIDLFAGLRWLVMEGERPLVLLAQSRTPFATLLPSGHPLSDIDLLTIELR